MKVFDPRKQLHGEYMEDNSYEAKLKTIMNSPMNEILEKFPDDVKEKFTEEMNKAIKDGMTAGEFIRKYIKDLSQTNMGL